MKAGHPTGTSWHRSIAMGTGAVVVAGMTVALSAGTAGADQLTDTASDPINIGHRASAGLAPENSLAGVELVKEQNPDFFEIDVQLSSDGVPVIMHDTTLARTTNVEDVFPGREGDLISSFTYDELQQLDSGSWYSEEFAGEKIPTLNEILDHGYPGPGIVIELKSPADSPGLVDVVVDELNADPRWNELADDGRLTAISFDIEAIHDFYEQRPDIPVMGLGAVPQSDAELAEVAEWATAWGTNYRTLNPADVDRVHDAGLLLNVYTVNSPEHMSDVIDLGVDFVTTDFPGVLEDLLAGADPVPDANGIVISDAVGNAPGDDVQPENGEYLVLTNTTDRPVNVGGYYINDAVINTLAVGRGYLIPAGGDLRVYTGPGTNVRKPSEGRYYNDYGRAVLNNGGDSLALFTPDDTLVDIYAY
ncbi:glycerophosphodiester phosphodiesterase family protein [Phytoactinopolyspora endophytica]|uniref:glycerophosphodiester phosphodiesterase family protein n=1 Tax=Phytoactinopolyspora endophytica TaxID=1642495 RepID=UPI00101B6668|nr:glycerophosphodiester phosphodiesterase family protein [Phytoactinopolyspora endophytica]